MTTVSFVLGATALTCSGGKPTTVISGGLASSRTVYVVPAGATALLLPPVLLLPPPVPLPLLLALTPALSRNAAAGGDRQAPRYEQVGVPDPVHLVSPAAHAVEIYTVRVTVADVPYESVAL